MMKPPQTGISTIVQPYSLAEGCIGHHIGPPSQIFHKNGEDALMYLDQAMSKPTTNGGCMYLIGFPDGATMPFNAAYRRIFGEEPVYVDNKRTKYPRLPRLASACAVSSCRAS